MDTDRILYNITYLKYIKYFYPETVDEDSHNSIVNALWKMYIEESKKENKWIIQIK